MSGSEKPRQAGNVSHDSILVNSAQKSLKRRLLPNKLPRRKSERDRQKTGSELETLYRKKSVKVLAKTQTNRCNIGQKMKKTEKRKEIRRNSYERNMPKQLRKG